MSEETKKVDNDLFIKFTECRLLNAIYLNNKILNDSDYSEDLYRFSDHRSISHAMSELVKLNVPITELSLYNETLKFDPEASKSAIHDIIEMNKEPLSTVKDITETLKSIQKSASAVDKLTEVQAVLSKNNTLTDDIKDSVRDTLYEVEDLVLSEDRKKTSETFNEWFDEYTDAYKQRRDGKQYWFNEPVLDEIVTDGPIPETGGLFVAQSGMGKSVYVLNLINRFIESGIPCMYFSLEMGEVTTMDRLLACRLQIPYSEIVNPSDSTSYYTIYQKIEEEREKLKDNKFFRFSEEPNLSIADIKKEIKKFQNEIGQTYCIVVIDLITMVKDFCVSDERSGNLSTKIEMAINKMNALSKELKIHYIGTAQLNRSGESAHVSDPQDIEKFRPTRAQVKNSGALIERCRYAISVFRPKYYYDQYFSDSEALQQEPDFIELQLLKQSNGQCKRLKELYNGECFSVIPIISPEPSENQPTES